MPNDEQSWWKQRSEADRAEVAEWFRSKAGQWVLWTVLVALGAWLIVQAVWTAL